MTYVSYKQGLKSEYINATKSPDALYWCTDTRELFKGEDLYTDGVRFAASYNKLPGVNFAAEGKLYICRDTGNGYLLNEGRTGWIIIIHGVDNDTLIYNEAGLLTINRVAMTQVDGLEKKLEDMLSAISGGIRYMGAVDTYNDLPKNATRGDLWEVRADNSEWCWNGTAWIEYGSTSRLKELAYAEANKEEFAIEDGILHLKAVDASKVFLGNQTLDKVLPTVYMARKYEVTNGLFEDTRVNYDDAEIRIMFAKDSPFKEVIGNNGDVNSYYVGLRAYAPAAAVNFKEDLALTISDETLYSFENNDFAGIDDFGRKYSIIWLPVAQKNTDGSWTYHGNNSTDTKMIGWYYSVEWYNANGKIIESDTIRINLTNEECHNDITPYYLESIQQAFTWQDI